jgi:MarR family transcriptional regulator, 2-MHQ and catechol-resistance regulon repressor
MSSPAAKPEFLYVLRQLIRCTQAFERYSGAHVKTMGLTESQFDVIATLGNTDGMTCKELGERTLITKGTLTGVLDRMESRALITRRSDADDARRTYIALTRKGHILFADVFPAHLAHLQRAFGRLSASELSHLQAGLSTLREAFEKEHAR